MLGERRRETRHSINRMAKIVLESGAHAGDCIITDISDRGARLHTEATNIPTSFQLMIFADKPIRQECQVVWQLGCEIGVEFTNDRRDQQRLNAMREFQSQARNILNSRG